MQPASSFVIDAIVVVFGGHTRQAEDAVFPGADAYLPTEHLVQRFLAPNMLL